MKTLAAFQLAWRYARHYYGRTALLAAALGLALALPLAVRALVKLAQTEMRARAVSTPLILGAKASPLELTFGALYFRRQGVETVPYREVKAVHRTGLAQAIPLYVRFHAREVPIVGTNLEYFSFRGLEPASGRLMGVLGECVVGAAAAREQGWRPGDFIFSSPEQVFDLAGVYPLKMRVSGVLKETGSADDRAVFVDVKTAWVIQGLAHGHEDLAVTSDASAVLSQREGAVTASKAVRLFNEITPANLESFHFHGDPDDHPLTAVIVLPHDAKSRAILLGRYQSPEAVVQLVEPDQEIGALLAMLVQAERFAVVLLVLLGGTVLLIAALVFTLSFRMRQREFATLADLGISRTTTGLVKLFEILITGGLAVAAGGLLLWVVAKFGEAWIRLGLH